MTNSGFSKSIICKAIALISVLSVIVGLTYHTPVYADDDSNYTFNGAGLGKPQKGVITLYRWKRVDNSSFFDNAKDKIFHFILVDARDKDHYYHGATSSNDNGWYRMFDSSKDAVNFYSQGVLVGGNTGSQINTIDFNSDEFITKESLDPLSLMYTGVNDAFWNQQKEFSISGAYYADIDKNPNKYTKKVSFVDANKNTVEYRVFTQKYWCATHDQFEVSDDSVKNLGESKNSDGSYSYNAVSLQAARWSIQFGVDSSNNFTEILEHQVGLYVSEPYTWCQDTRLSELTQEEIFEPGRGNYMIYGKDTGGPHMAQFIMYVSSEIRYSVIQNDYKVPVGSTINIDGNALADQNMEVGLFLSEGKKLTIPAGASLSLEGNFINNGTIEVEGTLVVQRDATIVTFGQTAASMGNIILKGGCLLVMNGAKVIIPGRGSLQCQTNGRITSDIINFGTIISAKEIDFKDTKVTNKSSGNILIGYEISSNLLTLFYKQFERAGNGLDIYVYGSNSDIKHSKNDSMIKGNWNTRIINNGLIKVNRPSLKTKDGAGYRDRNDMAGYWEPDHAKAEAVRSDFISSQVTNYRGSIVGDYYVYRPVYDDKAVVHGANANTRYQKKID